MTTTASDVRVAFIQDGARLHYTIPAALLRAGMLERVFTEWFVRPGTKEQWLSRYAKWVAPGLGGRMLERASTDLDGARVVQSIRVMLALNLSLRKLSKEERLCRLWNDPVSRWILKSGFGNANVVMGFIRRLDPELLKVCRRRGMKTVGDQMIAPAIVEQEEAERQQSRWPGWEPSGSAYPYVIEHERATWDSLDHITCASPYVRDGLLHCGVTAERISVLPYPIDVREFENHDRSRRDGPLVVGFVGGVSLRKGAPYFFEVARHFDPSRVRFVMVGPVVLDRAVAERHKGHVELVGPVPRSAVKEWLQRFDVFLFPSTCEGSAGSVTEAMATGLPVVTTPNSGSVVRDGEDGYVVSYDDTAAMAHKIGSLVDDTNLRLRLGRSARLHVERFNIDWYASQLSAMLRQIVN